MTDNAPAPDGPKDAHISTLTAEVKSLMVGSRQVTLSVYGQLDWVTEKEITPMGRVAPKDGSTTSVYVVGKQKGGGALARSWLPRTASAIERYVTERSSADAEERQAKRHDGAAAKHEADAQECEEQSAGKLDLTYGGAAYWVTRAAAAEAEATEHDREAETSIGVDRLTALSEAAKRRASAADDRLRAAKAEAEAANLQQQAAGHRESAQAARRHADKYQESADSWREWEGSEVERITTVAETWCKLPLIVLAGLR